MNFLRFVTKNIANKFAFFIVFLLSTNLIGRFFLDQIINFSRNKNKKIQHNEICFLFSIPNSLTYYRVNTFSSKEPDTLMWIDKIPERSVFWDVGANVGLYSCYAAKARNCIVFAFEPSVFNLEVLARNIYLNSLSDKITILPFPLSNSLSFNDLKMSSLELGGALSTFGENYGYDGKPLNKIFSFNTIGISADKAIDLLKISPPDYIKIDVDGIESLILQGAAQALMKVKGVLVEINEDFETQQLKCQSYLKSSGLVMVSKINADLESATSRNYNQIWMRI